ncbi:WD repeat-containing protein 20 isoform X2 [Electrophorus electricus]|uniref:WD repeat-containing protein 20 isoform X2 n=1 Tax=Electrophorus electricus TaxID=8005 RepID=UPI0015D0A45C|nr:WD repeat-containing protein 20 isoform X2 [Electrophorus electricus]
MAGDGGALKDINEIKCQFRTREGFYKLLTLSDSQQRGGLSRGPSASSTVGPGAGPGSIPGGGVGLVQGPGATSSSSAAANSSPAGFLPPVRVSMVKLQPEDPSEESERVCFNIGRELYFYTYTNIKKAVDLSKPIDKRIYKGTQPTCHDFNQYSATADSVALIVGFSAGQVQYLDPIKKETSKLFNEERLIDKTKVTCLKWLPKSENLFLASHASGHLYLYNVEHPCGTTAPQYSLLRQGEGFTVYACKTKTPRNPLLRWAVGEGGLNEFSFSPDGVHVACVGQDGCLRVFHFDSMELQGIMKSYFGGLLCVSWSPDGKYLATGGEDDLVTVWSFTESRVVARGHGHKSWVNVVAFDPFTTSIEEEEPMELSGSEEDLHQGALNFSRVRTSSTLSRLSRHSSKGGAPSVSYRFGSVGQDTQFCLWDLTDDILYPRLPLSRALTNTFSPNAPPSVSGGMNSTSGSGGVEGHHHPSNQPVTLPLPLPRSLSRSNSLPHPAVANATKSQGVTESGGTVGSNSAGGSTPFSIGRFATLSLQERKSDKSGTGGEKEHKRYHSLGNISKSNDKINVAPRSNRLDASKVLGTTLCPRMNEVPLLEPLVCKKIAHERLTVLVFMDDCIITACQEGLICTWARPGKVHPSQPLSTQNGNSPSGTVV